ncbi:hypothetical protein Vi05172_g2237 [Venturia inaequalis]|nr:hypothetical protein Vi05172_g2237 [Venturia inaequalis]
MQLLPIIATIAAILLFHLTPTLAKCVNVEYCWKDLAFNVIQDHQQWLPTLKCSGFHCVTENECLNIPPDDGPPYCLRRLESVEFGKNERVQCTIYIHHDCGGDLKREVFGPETGIAGTEMLWWEWRSLKCRGI